MQRIRGLGVKLLLLIIGGMSLLAVLITAQMVVSLLRVRDQALQNAATGLEDQSRTQLSLLHEQLTARIQERLYDLSDVNLTVSRAMLSANSSQVVAADYAQSVSLATLPSGVQVDPRPGRISSIYVPAGVDSASVSADLVSSALFDTLLPPQLLAKQGILAAAYVGPSGLVRLYPAVDVAQQTFAFEQALLQQFRQQGQRSIWLAAFPTPTFISTVDRRITAVVTPLYEAQTLRGILVSYISLGSLTADLIGIQPTQDSWIFVLGPDRQLIATSERFLGFLTDQAAPAASEVLTVTRTISPQLDQLIEQMVAGGQGLEKIPLADRQYLFTYRPILETNWSLALAVPIDELTKSASTVAESIVQTSQDTLWSTVLTTGPLLVAAILLGLYFTRRLTRPLGELASAARAIAHGSYTQEVKIHSRDEIGEVAEAFNLMSHSIVAAQAQLQQANRELEGTVHERTLDLETTIAQLQTSLDRQNDLDRQLKNASTPLIPVAPGVLLLPLIGSLDTQRMDHAASALLHYLENERVRDVILDLTGIPDITSDVASALIKVAAALRLMGAKTILTGITPEVAEALIALSSDLSGIQTVASLQSAITIAVQRTGARRR